MSTRCQIGVYRDGKQKTQDYEVLLYRHSDGYPGTVDGKEYGVLPDIIPFLKWWKDTRGISDTEYCGARLLQWLCNASDRGRLELENAMGKNTDYTGIYGHGICNSFHGDIEYFYKIYPNSVEVYDVTVKYNKNDYTIKSRKFNLMETIDL